MITATIAAIITRADVMRMHKVSKTNTLHIRNVCACGKPRPISGRRDICALCYYAQRVARAVETRIDRVFRREQQRRMWLRRAA